jgi:signal transduction histidine kinase
MERSIGPRRKSATLKLTTVTNQHINLDEATVGPIDIDLYIFDREPRILSLGVSDKKGLKEFLDESGGVRVYRDGIRVYDYGEKGNDWLNLGGRRVNIPTQRISNNLVLGAVSLNLADSLDLENNKGLIEKTNREGFVENESFHVFWNAVFLAITQIEEERNIDKTRIRTAYSSKKTKEPVLVDLGELRDKIEGRQLTKDLGPYIDRIEADFVAIRDRFLLSASAGLSLSVVIHEVEKGIQELSRAVDHEKTTSHIRDLARHLAELIEGYGALVRRSGMSRERASKLIEQALFNVEFRLRDHKINITVDHDYDFEVRCSRRLIIATMMNLIDNSIWWLENKWGNVSHKKRIFIGTTKEVPGGPAIVIADNGPGFSDPPEYLVEPFISRKPDGMGLGLHLADQVMKAQKGSLEFPDTGDISLPSGFTGAVVALSFGSAKK